MTTNAAATSGSIQLTADDFDQLAGILAAVPEFRSTQGRLDFLDDVFAGSPRRRDILGLLNLGGAPRGVAVRVIARLTQFGQDEPGRETLGVLVNKLLTYLGGGGDADFLRGLFARYPLHTEPAATQPIADWLGHESPEDVKETVIGENTLRDVRLLELALEASRAVVRINTGTKLGSGFLVGPGLVMTNNHVIGSPETGRGSAFTFNYQLDRAGDPAPTRATGAAPGGLFYTNKALDFTVIEIETSPADPAPLTLSRLRVKPKPDGRVNIIQHPGGHFKKISMTNNLVEFANARDLQYLTTTEPGSSGSPIFNDDFRVVGIHHSGGNLYEPGTESRFRRRLYLRNAGSSMIAVLDDLMAHASAIYARLNIG